MSTPNPPGDRQPALQLDLAALAARRSAAGVWSLAHLRICWLAEAVATAVVAVLGLVLRGAGALVGGLLGGVIVGLFFTVSAVAIARVGARNPKRIMPVAIGSYIAKVVLLGAVLTVMPRHGFVDTRWMALGVGVGLCVWLAAHMRYVWTAKIFYVDPSGTG
jgi:ATP synthase protein I